MIKAKIPSRAIGAGIAVAMVSVLAACAECGKDGDCPSGQQCVQGSCLPTSPQDTGSESEADVSGDEPWDVDVPDDASPDQDAPIDTGEDGCDDAACNAACVSIGYGSGSCTGDECYCYPAVDDVDAPVDPDVPDDAAGDEAEDVFVPECATATEAVDCDDLNACTIDRCAPTTLTCYHTPIFDTTDCSDTTFCNGIEQCTGGACAFAYDPCPPSTEQCMVSTCDEGSDSCDIVTAGEGTRCLAPSGNYCDGAFTCQTGHCNYAGDACPAGAPEPCHAVACNEAADACVEEPIDEGRACAGVPSGCGSYSVCRSGDCLAVASPCDDLDPCSVESCTISGGVPTCTKSPPLADGTGCDDGLACTGTGQQCNDGACVPSATHPCSDGDICTSEACFEGAPPVCVPPEPRTIPGAACDSVTGFTVADFWGHEYFSYGGSCVGAFLPGPETAFAIDLASPAHVVVQMGAVGESRLLLLSDGCDPASCLALDSAGTLDAGTLAAGTYTLVVDSGAKPQGGFIDVDCI